MNLANAIFCVLIFFSSMVDASTISVADYQKASLEDKLLIESYINGSIQTIVSLNLMRKNHRKPLLFCNFREGELDKDFALKLITIEKDNNQLTMPIPIFLIYKLKEIFPCGRGKKII